MKIKNTNHFLQTLYTCCQIDVLFNQFAQKNICFLPAKKRLYKKTTLFLQAYQKIK